MSSTYYGSTATEHFNKTASKFEAATGGGTRELAQHAISHMAALRPLTSDSKILDNACGTGIAADIILQSGINPEIHAVDVAEGMINIVKGRFSSHPNVHAGVMGGEDLSFPDDTFTHSITSLGIMYFADPAKGAREIARTLHPDGVAVITGWQKMTPIDIVREVQAQVRPNDAPFKAPLADIWLDPGHTKAVLSGAGLDVLVTASADVYMGGETTDEIADNLIHGFGARLFDTWSEEEKPKVVEVMRKVARERAVPFTRPSGSGIGIKLTGSIFVARKGSGR
ncbi:S-adenosyl-L-methionine-dependent methyltransferase, partial [Plectosphaerella plurivora]